MYVLLLSWCAFAADITYTDSGTDHLWSNTANWNGDTVPNDSLTGAAFDNDDTVVRITNGIDAVCKGFMLGMYGDTNSAEISGGTLSCSWLDVGRADQNGGNGSLEMTDGAVTVSGHLKIPTQFSTATDPDKLGTGHIDLLGGTITCGSFHMGSRLVGDGGGTGTMEITHGTLIVNGNQTSLLQGYIDNGWITFYGSGGDYELDYGVRNSGKTTLTATSTGQAFNPDPDNNAVSISLDKDLSWLVEATTGSVNVYFGTTDPPPFIRNQLLTETTYDPGQLAYNTTYYWQIDQIEGQDVIEGKIWSFTTDGPPAAAQNPDPADLAADINPNTKLIWNGALNADSYDVYFGDTNPPPLIGNQASSLYDPPMLEANTTYYWRIDSTNEHGTTAGPIWSFTISQLPDGDFNGDWFVDMQDLKTLASRWLDIDCQAPDWCGNTDINQDSNVNLIDFDLLSPQYGAKKPNIIIFFTDDQGWSETSVPMMQGRADSCSDFLQTPALEQMAQEGMVFSNAYSSAPTCTPSRGGILCGKTPGRLKATVVHDVLANANGINLADHVSIPQLIHSIDPNYVTAHFGKWDVHGGIDPEDDAEYDQSDGKTGNGEGDYLDVQARTPLPADDPKRIFSVADRADDFMEEQVVADRPFFMQLSHYAVHVDHMALSETIEKYRNLPPASQSKYNSENGYLYAAMIENLDAALGRVLQKLEQLGIKDNTYIIFTSDNGGGFGGNAPLKGGKAQLWEGGLRVPTVICGPGVIKSSYCDKPIAAWDFLPTINEIVGGDPLPTEYDGGSLLDVLRRGNDGQIHRGTKELIFHYPYYAGVPNTAMRDGNYKLIMNLNNYEYRLFDLSTDIGEQNDLKDSMPQLAQQMYDRLNQYLADVDAEDVEEMRLARIAELEGWIANELAKETPDLARIESWESSIDQAEQNRLLDMDGNIIE
jgi:arylsulfatase A-like enzyme